MIQKLRFFITKFKLLKTIFDIPMLDVLCLFLNLNYGSLVWGGVTTNYFKNLELIKMFLKAIALLNEPHLFEERKSFCIM